MLKCNTSQAKSVADAGRKSSNALSSAERARKCRLKKKLVVAGIEPSIAEKAVSGMIKLSSPQIDKKLENEWLKVKPIHSTPSRQQKHKLKKRLVESGLSSEEANGVLLGIQEISHYRVGAKLESDVGAYLATSKVDFDSAADVGHQEMDKTANLRNVMGQKHVFEHRLKKWLFKNFIKPKMERNH